MDIVTLHKQSPGRGKTLMAKYIQCLGPAAQDAYEMPEKWQNRHEPFFPIGNMDYFIRYFIGKTDDIEKLRVGFCSHQAILERERDEMGIDPETRCRKCGIPLDVDGELRCNDFLVLRNPFCKGPICMGCIKRGGDVFYKAFRSGLDKYKRLRSNSQGDV